MPASRCFTRLARVFGSLSHARTHARTCASPSPATDTRSLHGGTGTDGQHAESRQRPGGEAGGGCGLRAPGPAPRTRRSPWRRRARSCWNLRSAPCSRQGQGPAASGRPWRRDSVGPLAGISVQGLLSVFDSGVRSEALGSFSGVPAEATPPLPFVPGLGRDRARVTPLSARRSLLCGCVRIVSPGIRRYPIDGQLSPEGQRERDREITYYR